MQWVHGNRISTDKKKFKLRNKRIRTEDSATNASNNNMKLMARKIEREREGERKSEREKTTERNGSVHKKRRWDDKCIMKTEHTITHYAHCTHTHTSHLDAKPAQTVIKCVYTIRKTHASSRSTRYYRHQVSASSSRLSVRHLPQFGL